MSIREIEGKIRLDFRWPDTGQRERDSSFPTIMDARAFLLRVKASKLDNTTAKLRAQYRLGNGHGSVLTVKALSDLYRSQRVALQKSRRHKSFLLDTLVAEFGGEPAEEIRTTMISSWVADRLQRISHRSGRPILPRTVNRLLSVMKDMYRWGKGKHIISVNPIEDYELLDEVEWEGPRPEDYVVQAVLDACPGRLRAICQFIRETGCRLGEALSLEWWQVDLKAGVVNFVGAKCKSKKGRSVPLTGRAREILASQRKGSSLVFYNPKTGKQWCHPNAPWIAARTKAGYPWLRIHDLRKAYAIELAESGAHMFVIQKMLGHSSVATTERYYAKYSPDRATDMALAILERNRNGDNVVRHLEGVK